MAKANDTPLSDILNQLSSEAEDGVTLNGLLAAFEDRSTGVLVTLFALVAAIPVIGGIPGVSVATGILILLTQAVTLFGRGRMRLPAWLGGEVTLPEDKIESGVSRAKPVAEKIDGLLTDRLEFLTATTTMRVAIHAAIAVLAVAMLPLAFVPWGVTLPALGIMAFGAALVSRDGIAALLGYALFTATIAATLWAA